MGDESATTTSTLARNNVRLSGVASGRPIVFIHGFGCSQSMWTAAAALFEHDHRVVLLDLVGAGDSDLSQYDDVKYDSLYGYADDIVEVLAELDLHDAVIVGHSVGAMIGVLAANAARDRVGSLVLVGPSPRYVNDVDYIGGYEQADIDALLDALDANHLGWASTMGTVIVGNIDRPELAEEWRASFCRTDPAISRHFARVTFLSDNRRDLQAVSVPTLVVQSRHDAISPEVVGRYVHERIASSEFVIVEANGHTPNLSAPAATASVIRSFLG